MTRDCAPTPGIICCGGAHLAGPAVRGLAHEHHHLVLVAVEDGLELLRGVHLRWRIEQAGVGPQRRGWGSIFRKPGLAPQSAGAAAATGSPAWLQGLVPKGCARARPDVGASGATGTEERAGSWPSSTPASRHQRRHRLSHASCQLLPLLTVATGAAISSALGASSRLLAAAAAFPRRCDSTATRRASRGRALTARGAAVHTEGRARLQEARLRVSAGAAIFVLPTVKGIRMFENW